MLLSLSCSAGFNHCLIRNSDSCLTHNSSPRCFRHALVYRMTPFPVLTRPHWVQLYHWLASHVEPACLSSRGLQLAFYPMVSSFIPVFLHFRGPLCVIELSQIVQIAFEVEPQAKSPCKKYRWNARPVALRCRARRILFDLYEMPSAGRCQSRLAPPTPC